MTELGIADGHVSRRFYRGPVSRLDISWAARTDVGKRRERNEDSFVAQMPLFAVADGMGGHDAGDVASQLTVTRLSATHSERTVTPAGIERALKRASNDLVKLREDTGAEAGTTVTGIGMMRIDQVPHWLVFNIGDSRVLSWRQGSLKQITRDHSLVQYLVDLGQLAPEDAEGHPDSNIITRAIGFRGDPLPDYWLVPMRGKARMLLCSDGLFKELSNDKILAVLDATATCSQAADELVRLAIESGGRDNVTVIVVESIAQAATSAQAATQRIPGKHSKATQGDSAKSHPAGADDQSEPDDSDDTSGMEDTEPMSESERTAEPASRGKRRRSNFAG